MQAYWTEQKPDGTPITDGRLCRVVDLEDGSIPVRVYGKTQEEVFSKIERTMATAQMTVNNARRGDNGDGWKPVVFGPIAGDPQPNPAILSADETMRLTADLQNPAKSAEASYKLAESERAKRADVQERFLAVCRAFTARHPEFYRHQFNRNLLITSALLSVANDASRVTDAVLDSTYEYLRGRGDLLTESDVVPRAPANNNDEPSTVHPDGNPGPVPVRPSSGVTSSTSHRSSRLGAPAPPQWKPKVTREEIGKLTIKDTDAILRGLHPRITKKDYDDACEFYWPQRQATA
jgi:hypothetical protein